MRVAVVGAGIVGMTTAYELNADGHAVTVFERRGSVAAEGSFANAGVVAPGYVTPWAAPGMPAKVLAHLFRRHAPVRLRGGLDMQTAAWVWHWWRACRVRTYRANRLRMQRLAQFSRERLHRITRELKLDYERSEGYLVLLRTAQESTAAEPGLETLAALNIRFDLLDAAQCRAVEPNLSPDAALHQGIYLPDDEVGNCREFATLLRAQAQRLGVRFRFHTQVQRLVPGATPQLVRMYAPPKPSATGAEAIESASNRDAPDTQPMAAQPVVERFDAIVVCAATGSAALLAPHGLRLPIQPVYGCSITAPLRRHDGHFDQGPRSALMDERYKVAISRLGARVRVAGGAELGGSLETQHASSFDTLYKVLNDWFPGSVHERQAQRWKGARPMLPDGPPVIGRSGIDGVWLNLGHGSSGWALACGSARVVADAVAGRASVIDTEGLGIERLRARP